MPKNADAAVAQGDDEKTTDPGVTFVRMVLEEPAFPGGPTTADVHPSEVVNYARGGWITAPEAPPATKSKK